MHGGLGARHGRPGGALACAWWAGRGPVEGVVGPAWAHAGVQLLHYTGYQRHEGPHVPLNQLRRGDGMYQPGGLIGAVRPAG